MSENEEKRRNRNEIENKIYISRARNERYTCFHSKSLLRTEKIIGMKMRDLNEHKRAIQRVMFVCLWERIPISYFILVYLFSHRFSNLSSIQICKLPCAQRITYTLYTSSGFVKARVQTLFSTQFAHSNQWKTYFITSTNKWDALGNTS